MQALKDVALRLLNVYVSPYVENLNPHDLSLSVFGGNLQFHGLHLKKSLLERFGLPIEILAGDIGDLSVSIPWTQLKTQPVKIFIEDVYVLARARPQGMVDPEEDERVEQTTKQEKLKSAEAVDSAASEVGRQDGDEGAKETYVGAIISKIVDNVQVQVKNIHIRYEDGTSTPEHPFAAGLTLTEFKAVSTDANWVEAFIQDSLKGVHKLVKLGALSVYFDTDTGSLDKGVENRQGTLGALKAMLQDSPKHQYILKPVTGEARVIVNKSMSSKSPKVDAQVMFDEIGVIFDRDQYRDALSLLDVIHFYRRTHQYHKFRPPEKEFESNPGKMRMQFALNAIRSEVHERNRRWSWAYLADRRDKRRTYVATYTKKLALQEGKALSTEDATILADMERDLSYEDIRFFRSVARAQAKKDEATRRKLEADRRKNQPQRQTWGEWMWGVPKAEESSMSDEEKKQIDEIIDYDSAAAEATIGTTPRDYMKARVSAKLNKGSFSLRTDPHGKDQDIINLVFDSFSADALQLTDSVTGKIALGGFRVYDGTTSDSLYPQIVRVKDIETAHSDKGKGRQTSLDAQGGTDGAIEDLSDGLETHTGDEGEVDPFFVMEVEQNPLDGHADNVLKVKMRHLEIIYHKGYVEAVVEFFKPPASQLESISALLDAAGQTLDGIRKETRAGLEYALEEHKTVDIRVDMNAPIIIIPMDIKAKDSEALVLDAGHIAVESELADEKQLKDIQSKRGRQYDDDDFRQLEGLMYDKLSLRLQATQLLMGPSVNACLRVIDEAESLGQTDLHILEKINMSFTVQNAIVNAPNLTRFKVSGKLPELQVNFSDRKYKTLMRYIDVAIPQFGDDEPREDAPKVIPAQPRPPFRKPEIEEYTLDDTRSITSARTSDEKDEVGSAGDKGTDQFYEAQDDTTDSQRKALHQVTFEFSFSVGKLQASLYKSDTRSAERALANAVLEGFGLTFDLRQYDMSVDLFLRSVTLAMIEQGQAQRPLLSSANENKADTDLKLLQVRYVRVQKDSPEFMPVHEGVDQSVDVELTTFKITVAPEPILSLYDFIMTAFVSQDEPFPEPAVASNGDVVAVLEEGEKTTDKIRVRVKVTTASVSLENNENRFALLSLPSADVAILLRSGTMRIGARLGNISIQDVSPAEVAVPEFKKLLVIEGEELADFSYEMFDPAETETFPGFNSSIHLRTGSLKFTFMEKPINDLYAFALKFARMKAVYDAASQAAVQRASEVTRIHYDVVVKTPIIVLPRDGLVSPDILILRLGEIVAKNEYLGDPDDTSTIAASLCGINVATEITLGDRKATIQMVDEVAVTAKVRQAGGNSHRADPHHADTEIATEMTDVEVSLTQNQYMLLMGIIEALPRALNSDTKDGEISPESVPGTPSVRSMPPTPSSEKTISEVGVNLEPELAVVHKAGEGTVENWTSLDVMFKVNSIALQLYDAEAHEQRDLQQHGIARFALIDTHVGMKQLADGAMEAEFSLKTLAFNNTRPGKSVFREIIPPAAHDGKQIMLQYTQAGGSDKSALAIVTVDSPHLILAVDPLATLLEFAMSPFKGPSDDAPAEPQEVLVEEGPTKQSSSLAFRVEIFDSTVVVVANEEDKQSQAIHLRVKEVLLSQQSVLALKVDKLGMSFGQMERGHDRVRFLDELNVALSLDTRRRGSQQMTSLEVDIPDPVIFRASYTDIMLIMDIVNKASAAAQKVQEPVVGNDTGKKHGSLKIAAATDAGSSAIVPIASKSSARKTVSKRRSSADRSRVLVSKEQLKARINGFQLVMVADLQELPFVHLSSSEFNVLVNDWSGDMKMATSITTSIRYFNLTNSYFEPLMDPWKFDLRINRTTAGPDFNPYSIKLSAAERLELNMTSAFIELAITSMTIWSREADRIKEGRGTDSPFRVRNRTGLTILVWPEQRDLNKSVTGVKRLDDGADVPWRFEDRKQTRDNVSAVRHNSLGLQLEKTPWEPIRGISVDREGDHLQTLQPKLDRISHQLTCEIKLENNIKVITIRSTLNVENKTSFPLEMIVVDSHGKASTGALKIDPGESCPLPVEAAFDKRFKLRPLKGFGFDYNWSGPLHWKSLMQKKIRAISCKHRTPQEPPFYLQSETIFDDMNPLAKLYPLMTLRLRAPVEVENLLPYDIQYRIHDKNTNLSSSLNLIKGGTSPVHTVDLGHLLLISVQPEDLDEEQAATPGVSPSRSGRSRARSMFKQSEYAIINTDDTELPVENVLKLVDEKNLELELKIHYYLYPHSGGAFKIQIYSPFIFINKTGLPFDIAATKWSGGQRTIAGSSRFGKDYEKDTPTPFMFAFPEGKRDKLFVRIMDSKWSKPLSFEPVSADMQLIMGSTGGDTNYYVGCSFAEGLGKYKLSKVITIAPRFIVKNMFSYVLRIRQHSSQTVLDLKPGDRAPIHELQSRAPPQLSMTIDESNAKWSAPFNIFDIGRTNLVMEKQSNRGTKQYLMRVETHIEGSSIFLYISRETEPWPLKLRNETDIPFTFQQAENESARPKYPLRDLAAHDVADYAWDYPTASNKRIKLLADGVPLPRTFDMMAIGVQPPLKISSKQPGKKSSTVSLDIQADGNSQLLVISHYNEDTNVYKPARRSTGTIRRSDSTDSINTSSFETVQVSERATLNITIELEGIGISIITKRPDELVYLSLRGLKLGYSDFPQYYDAFVDCKWIQIDNQLFGGIFPIILYPTVVPKDGKELDSHPTLQASVAILKDRSHGVWFIKYATILLQAMTIELDEDFLFALLDFAKFKDAAWREPSHDILIEHPKDIPEPDMKTSQADVFFEALQLQPVSLELSFMRTDRVNVEEKVSTRNPFYYALNALTMTLGNVNAAPVNFRALFLENVRLSIPSLQERVQLHYQEQFMSQIYRVLGSADFLGNPVGLFSHISSGVSDIFYEPYQGIVMHGNKDIGLGIARGATSFAKKTVFGITDSMTKFTSSIGKGLSAATLDVDYQNKRRMTQRRNKPKHALYGVAAGASAFADSVTSAFEGVASKPMEGAEKDGAAGFAKGVGKGFVGLFTKPAVGVMDFLSASTEGIRNTTTVFDQNDLDRVRLPRHISSDGVLRPFSARDALGQSWLKDLDAGAYFQESYVAHLDIPGDDAVSILSNDRILYVQLRKLRVIWQVPFEELQSLSLEASGILLILRGGTPGPFLPISEQTGREWYFRHIGKVVIAYNKAHAQKDE